MIFAGPALNLGHPARPAVTGLGISAYVFAPVDEIPVHSKPTYPSREVLEQVYETYPERLQPGQPPLEVVGEMHLNREEVALPTAEIEWHPEKKPGTLIGRPGSCDQVLGRKTSNPLSRRNTRLPRRR